MIMSRDAALVSGDRSVHFGLGIPNSNIFTMQYVSREEEISDTTYQPIYHSPTS